jgi:hypothetical protein
MQKLGANMLLEVRDCPTDCGGRTSELASGGGETAFVERGHEHLHCFDAIHRDTRPEEQRPIVGENDATGNMRGFQVVRGK